MEPLILLLGNPNCGKSTVYNALTGGREHVGNFPGVTVEKRQRRIKNSALYAVDLPGLYSLIPDTGEEAVARRELLSTQNSVIVNIIDGACPARNLYLTLQLLEMQRPMIVAVNRMDEVRQNGGSVDEGALQKALGVPVVPISAAKGEGMETLRKTIESAARSLAFAESKVGYGPEIEQKVRELTALMRLPEKTGRYTALRLMEGDEGLARSYPDAAARLSGPDWQEKTVRARYGAIDETARCFSLPEKTRQERFSEAVDRIVLRRGMTLLGFALWMGLVFFAVFGPIGQTLCGMLQSAVDGCRAAVRFTLTDWGAAEWVIGCVTDGVLQGIGSVLSFLPVIVLLFFFLAVTEDCGYMARLAAAADAPMRRFGLSGKALVPLLVGFGCSVPAILSARTLAEDNERRAVCALIPMMSCGAKTAVYAMVAAAIFGKRAGIVTAGLYLFGIVCAVGAAAWLKRKNGLDRAAQLILELPPYRLPQPGTVLLRLWERVKDFSVRAFTIIFLSGTVVWFLQHFDAGLHYLPASGPGDLLQKTGSVLCPLFKAAGFADPRIVCALISGLFAKETAVSVLRVSAGENIAALFDPASALSFLVFFLLYTPCIAALSAMRRESGSRAFPLAIALGQGVLAWCAAVVIHAAASAILGAG